MQIIGGMQVVSALFNLLIAALWVFNGVGGGVMTCGVTFSLMPVTSGLLTLMLLQNARVVEWFETR